MFLAVSVINFENTYHLRVERIRNTRRINTEMDSLGISGTGVVS